MERLIGSSDPASNTGRRIRGIQKRLPRPVTRFLVTTLLVLPVVLVVLTGSIRTELVPFLSAFEASAAARDRTPPTAPSNLRVTGVTTASVSLAWSPSTDNSGSFSYRIRHSGGYQAIASQAQTSLTWTSNLTAGQTYSFFVYAVDAEGNTSRNSNTVTVTLLRNPPPPPPPPPTPPAQPLVRVTDIGPTHISLAWASIGSVPLLRYSVFIDGRLHEQPTPNTSDTFYLLDPETTHTFTVQARVGASLSAFSDPVTVTTEPINPNDTTAPTMPANLLEDHWAGESEIFLSWNPSADNLDPQAIIRYNVYVNGVLDDIRVGTNRTSVYVDPGFNTISVVAVDTAGNESAEATITLFFF
jgi:chitinase